MSGQTSRVESTRRRWLGLALTCGGGAIVVGAIGVWLASATSLALRAAVEVEGPTAFGILAAVLAFLLVRVCIAANRARYVGAGMWGATCIVWLGAAPELVTAWSSFAAAGPAARTSVLAVLLAAGLGLAIFAAAFAPQRCHQQMALTGSGVAQLAGEGEGEETLRSRARHEAAHAVAATALGAQVTLIDVIRRHSGIGGSCTHSPVSTWSAPDRMWAQLVISVAANVSDLDDGVHDFGATSDMQLALQQAAAIISTGCRPTGYAGGLQFDDLLAGARELAAEILTANEAAIATLTDLLEATAGKHTLRFADLGDFRARVTPHPWSELEARRTAPVDNH